MSLFNTFILQAMKWRSGGIKWLALGHFHENVEEKALN